MPCSRRLKIGLAGSNSRLKCCLVPTFAKCSVAKVGSEPRYRTWDQEGRPFQLTAILQVVQTVGIASKQSDVCAVLSGSERRGGENGQEDKPAVRLHRLTALVCKHLRALAAGTRTASLSMEPPTGVLGSGLSCAALTNIGLGALLGNCAARFAIRRSRSTEASRIRACHDPCSSARNRREYSYLQRGKRCFAASSSLPAAGSPRPHLAYSPEKELPGDGQIFGLRRELL